MPIRVRYQNDSDQECTIRPTPLVSINTQILKTPAGEAFGVNYSIVLTGTLLADQGTPYAVDHIRDGGTNIYPFHGSPSITQVGPYNTFDSNISHILLGRPPKQQIHINEAATAILSKQKALRALFAQDGQRMEITDFTNDSPTVICYPRLVDINFDDGIYIDTCDFTITLEADTILYGQDEDNLIVDNEGSFITGGILNGKTETQLLNSYSGAFIRSYTEEWAIEVNEEGSETPDIPFSYRISHNISAAGKTHYTPNGTKLVAWEQARTFVQDRLEDSVTAYPNVMGVIGSGTVNLINSYGGYNHVRTETIGESEGTYSVSENWVIASGSSYENYTSTVSTSTADAFVAVSVNGTITGLSQISPSGYTGSSEGTNAFDSAQSKYNQVSNSGAFGLTSDIFARANNLVAVQLNSQPLTVSIASNKFAGEINYDISFDNRPTNFISGVLSEGIDIRDTYPGDIFASIPVIGRETGPMLQYVGGRTAYRRDLSLTLQMDYTKIPYSSGRNPLLLKKPSVIQPTADQIADLITQVSPQGEPGIRKYFVSPATEDWSPKTGGYSFNLSWTYELDK